MKDVSQDTQVVRTVRNPNDFARARVDIKSVLKFLNSHVVASTTIACTSSFVPARELVELDQKADDTAGICEGVCAIFYVYVGTTPSTRGGGVLTFFLPARVDDEE